MGYHTDFDGEFNFNTPLDEETATLINKLAHTRRMKRDTDKLKELGYTGDYGVEGEFFCDGTLNTEGDLTRDSITHHNDPPADQPSLWLQWVVSEDRTILAWDGNEKFYCYIEWLHYLINKILAPRNYQLDGAVRFRGEDFDDIGTIMITGNVVSVEYR